MTELCLEDWQPVVVTRQLMSLNRFLWKYVDIDRTSQFQFVNIIFFLDVLSLKDSSKYNYI